jgi:hypothetical protein
MGFFQIVLMKLLMIKGCLVRYFVPVYLLHRFDPIILHYLWSKKQQHVDLDLFKKDTSYWFRSNISKTYEEFASSEIPTIEVLKSLSGPGL